MRISDWSSDVCSSDLALDRFEIAQPPHLQIVFDSADTRFKAGLYPDNAERFLMAAKLQRDSARQAWRRDRARKSARHGHDRRPVLQPARLTAPLVSVAVPPGVGQCATPGVGGGE